MDIGERLLYVWGVLSEAKAERRGSPPPFGGIDSGGANTRIEVKKNGE